MTFTVRQSVEGGALRVILATDDEGLARAVYAIHRTAARKGVYTELADGGGEILDCDLSDRGFAFKAARRAPRQATLF